MARSAFRAAVLGQCVQINPGQAARGHIESAALFGAYAEQQALLSLGCAEVEGYITIAGPAPTCLRRQRACVGQVGAWPQVAETFGLKFVRHNPGSQPGTKPKRSHPLNAPLTYEERHACKLRAQVEVAW